MITVIIKDDGEPNVIKLTYENLWRELKNIEGAELKVSKDWFGELLRVKNKFVCLVEADCLVSSGYFESQINLLLKNSYHRKIVVMSSSTAVRVWANRFYGYNVSSDMDGRVIPIKDKNRSTPHTVEISYIPGAIMRTPNIIKVLTNIGIDSGWEKNLLKMSIDMSLGIWETGFGESRGNATFDMFNFINPTATYATTEEYVNDIGEISPEFKNIDILLDTFKKQAI